jgi:hypothetical protein
LSSKQGNASNSSAVRYERSILFDNISYTELRSKYFVENITIDYGFKFEEFYDEYFEIDNTSSLLDDSNRNDNSSFSFKYTLNTNTSIKDILNEQNTSSQIFTNSTIMPVDLMSIIGNQSSGMLYIISMENRSQNFDHNEFPNKTERISMDYLEPLVTDELYFNNSRNSHDNRGIFFYFYTLPIFIPKLIAAFFARIFQPKMSETTNSEHTTQSSTEYTDSTDSSTEKTTSETTSESTTTAHTSNQTDICEISIEDVRNISDCSTSLASKFKQMYDDKCISMLK